MTAVSPIRPEDLREPLSELLVRELRVWHDAFAEEHMRAFDLGCFPWHGYLELSFLTTYEPALADRGDPFSCIAEWKLYNFGVRSAEPIPTERKHLGRRMQLFWESVEAKGPVSERFLTAAAEAVSSDEVQVELARYRRTSDFVTTVFDPDRPDPVNLVRITGAHRGGDD